MKITDLKQMEIIVESHPKLKWNGWDVVFLEEDAMAYMNKDAIFSEEKWYKKTVYKYINNHWNIPNKVLSGYV